VRLRPTILRRIGSIDAYISELQKELEAMRNDPDYLACMKAWKNGIGWSNKYTSEDVNSWIEAIDNQRAIIDDAQSRKQELEDLLNV
jgi:hypothetical protein